MRHDFGLNRCVGAERANGEGVSVRDPNQGAPTIPIATRTAHITMPIPATAVMIRPI